MASTAAAGGGAGDAGLETRIASTVTQAKRAFRSGATRPLAWRRKQLQAIIRLVQENKPALEAALMKDLGVNKFWVDNVDLHLPVAEAKFALDNLADWVKPDPVPTPLIMLPASCALQHEPLGTVLIIAPWNYPVSLVLDPLIAAVAAGNSVIIKPSEVSVNTSALLSSLLRKYLDNDTIFVVEGAVPETTELLKHHFDLVFYTGSTAVGRIVMQAAAKTLTPVVLELGGKCPAIVAKDADVNKVAKRICWGKWSLNNGQTCLTVDYIITEAGMREKLIEAIKKTLVEFYGSNPKESKDVSRMINERHARRIAALLEDDPTIEVHTGGEHDFADRYVAPTVVSATADSKCMKDEIFGPILPILEVDNIDAAIDFVMDRPKPLALYCFTETTKVWKHVLGNTTSGSACVNDVSIQNVNLHLPFGGVGESGTGSYHGYHGFTALSHCKAVLIKKGSDPPIRFPPYTDSKLKLLGHASHWLGDLDTNSLKKAAKYAVVAGVAAAVYFARETLFG